MNTPLLIFVASIFLAVFLLMQGLVVPTMGSNAQMRRRLRRRIDALKMEQPDAAPSLLRARYLEGLTPFQKRLESLPVMESLRRIVEQAGLDQPAHYFVLQALALGLCAIAISVFSGSSAAMAWALGALAGAAPFIRLGLIRGRRIQEIEEQLPDAIDVIKRSVRAGHPFIAANRLVGEDMEGAIGKEFAITAADFAYGSDPRAALLGLVSRVPSMTLMGFVTAVLIQRETGGNLAEILENISQVIRARYRFQRKIRTLSAEGRVSAWVLTLMPISLAGVLHLTSPHYLPILFQSRNGLTLLSVSSVLMVVGIYWMRKIIRIEL
jgi:tight adherence protein B